MFTGDVSGVLQVSLDFMNIMGGMGNVSIFQGDEEVRSLILDMTPNSWKTLYLKDIALSGEGYVSIVVGRANSEEYMSLRVLIPTKQKRTRMIQTPTG